jgi:hypothetical protein
VSTVTDDPLLGFALPRDDPRPSARTAPALGEAAERVGVLLRRVGAMLPVQRWSGTASLAADRQLASVALGLAQERLLLGSAADALTRFAVAVTAAQGSADEARRLVSAARAVQRSADLRAAATAPVAPAGWGGVRADGVIHDPTAVALLDRARVRAYVARTTYDSAARHLTAELTDLSGRRVVRAGLSPRLLLDVVGLVPVAGDAVDLGNAVAYALQGRWDDASLTAVAAVPGPEGWAAASAKAGRAVSRAGRVERVVTVGDDVPPEQQIATVLAGLLRGRRKETRVLPDDDAVTQLYREAFHPLGATTVTQGSRGEVLVTRLPGGGRVSYRTWSRCGGATIEFAEVTGVDILRIHREDC